MWFAPNQTNRLSGGAAFNSSLLRARRLSHHSVVTGPPCSGKTTLISGLQRVGYATCHEIAAELIAGGVHPAREPERFDELRWMRQLEVEAQLPPTLSFGDRGLFDAFAYRRYYGQPIPPYMREITLPRYRMVFILQPLPWVDDGVRFEDSEFQTKILPLFIEAYEEHGVRAKLVPVMSPDEMLAFVIEEAIATAKEILCA